VKEEAFLEFINQLLATGEVAGLFARDEVDSIVNDIRPVMRAEAPGKPMPLLQPPNALATASGSR
jgi:dynein heavy chain